MASSVALAIGHHSPHDGFPKSNLDLTTLFDGLIELELKAGAGNVGNGRGQPFGRFAVENQKVSETLGVKSRFLTSIGRRIGAWH